jgi:hypothetical protein
LCYRRRIQAAQKYKLISEPSKSCRIVCSKYLCGEVDPFEPKTWSEQCLLGTCSACPVPVVQVPAGRGAELVILSLWCQKNFDSRKRYGLWNVSVTLDELAKSVREGIRDMKIHIFTAATCWCRLHQHLDDLRPGKDVLLVEDYQRNAELEHGEMTTSTAYSANTFAVAIFPMVLKFRRPPAPPETSSPLETAGIVFISADTHHGFQQVAQFEKRALEIFGLEVFVPEGYIRWSDGAASQFKSRFVLHNLLHVDELISPHLKTALYCFFESHEGKNASDTLGSIIKAAIGRASMTTQQGFGGPSDEEGEEQIELTILRQLKERIMSTLNFGEDGRLGTFSFLK